MKILLLLLAATIIALVVCIMMYHKLNKTHKDALFTIDYLNLKVLTLDKKIKQLLKNR